MTAAEWLTSDAVTEALARIKAANDRPAWDPRLATIEETGVWVKGEGPVLFHAVVNEHGGVMHDFRNLEDAEEWLANQRERFVDILHEQQERDETDVQILRARKALRACLRREASPRELHRFLLAWDPERHAEHEAEDDDFWEEALTVGERNGS